MNNRYFIQIDVSCINPYIESTMIRWYDDPDKLLKYMQEQFTYAVYDLASRRGKYMRKLEKEGVDWFKENINKLFDCTIKVIRFNHSFDNYTEFKEWLKTNNISQENDYALSGSLEERKALQDYAVDYYIDWYDADFNKTDSTSIIYGESTDHKRTGHSLNFKVGDHVSYLPHGDTVYSVVSVPDPYSYLYWHDGYINVYDVDDTYIELGEFDLPNYIQIAKENLK